jgi:hypothetical protein
MRMSLIVNEAGEIEEQQYMEKKKCKEIDRYITVIFFWKFL